MPILRLPKTIRWMLACALFFLVVMSLYRVGVHLFFDYGKVSDKDLPLTLWTGFRYDARVVGGFTLFLVLVSFFPAFHFFKTTLGKNTALFLYFLFTLGLLAFYAADTVSLFVHKTRLNGSLIPDLAKDTEKGRLFSKGAPWIAIFLFGAIACWLIFMLIKLLHRRIAKKTSSADHRLVRIYWQVLLVLLCLLGVYGRLGKEPLNTRITLLQLSPKATQVALNPFESFVSTLPD